MPESTPSLQQIHDIFQRDDYFYCTRERCSMRKTLCIQYQQQANIKMKSSYVVGFNTAVVAAERINCLNCEQGKLIEEELKKKEIIK